MLPKQKQINKKMALGRHHFQIIHSLEKNVATPYTAPKIEMGVQV